MEHAERRPISPAQREAALDRYMSIAIWVLVGLVLVAAAAFGYMVWQESRAQKVSAPAQRVIDDVAASVRKFPNNAALRVRLGEAYASAGLYDEAIEQLKNAIKIDETHTGA